MKEITRRFEQLLWEGDASDNDSAEELYRAILPAGSSDTWYWGDVDYTDKTMSFWCTKRHLDRIKSILRAFGKARFLENGEYTKRMVGALRYWLVNDFENPNWWHNQIGVPETLGDIAIMMRSALDDETLHRAVAIISRGSMAKNERIAEQWTGANLMWGALNTVRHALLTEDEPLLMRAVGKISEEITVGKRDGIQEDNSFFQHGKRLYSGGYGRSFLYGISKLLFLINGTGYQLSPEKVEIILSFVLDGVRPMVQGHSLDWSCVGREITRPDALDVGLIKTALEILLSAEKLPRKDELKAFLESIQGGEQPTLTKYFDKACMLCHHFNGIYVGAKFLGDELLGAEICIGEGALCYNMSYGTQTCIMRGGDEYFNIAPVWDYSRIPGTTSLIETDEQLLARKGWGSRPLPNQCFGGKQQGGRAVIYELAEHDGIKMLAADFAFEDGFVCLGVEVEPQDAERDEFVTTVDQCLVQSEVLFEDDSILHNGIRYTSLQNTHISSAVETKRGSWRRNNGGLPEDTVSADVLTLSIYHSEKSKCQYAYMISSADMPTPRVEVLQNDSATQAIRLPDGSVMAVFHRADVLLVGDKKILGNAGDILC
ncbi:MAG: hypothetical protein IJE25_03915 [Clostridia bacterium]|nr:hypothetical protein [Clostridia bacterium]